MNRFRSNDNGNNRFSSLKSTETTNVFLSSPTNTNNRNNSSNNSSNNSNNNSSNNNSSNNNSSNNSSRYNTSNKYSSRHSNSNSVSINERVHVQPNDHFPELTSNKITTPVIIDTIKESTSVIQPNKPMSLAEMVKGGNKNNCPD
jgi:hypothetical protein